MPNTLVHLGVQSVSSKALFKGADFKLIALGSIIPDIPWIVQRGIIFLQLDVSTYDLSLYATVQTSLAFCLLLCGVFALFCSASGRMFLLLGFNSLFHLLLDALQIKWANGVYFFAPFSWQMTGFGLAWPEHPVFLTLTAAGLAALVYFGIRDWKTPVVLTTRRSGYGIAGLLLAVYLILPFKLMAGPENRDSHYAATFRNAAERAGKEVELDRSRYSYRDRTVLVFAREHVRVTGPQPDHDAILSLRGRFTDNSTLQITEYHVHSPHRDASSAIALAGIGVIWLLAFQRKKVIFRKDHHNKRSNDAR